MSYVNAEDVLPKILVEEIQKYVDGQLIYVPRKNENLLSWGEKNGTKEKMAERNQTIVKNYYSGHSIEELSAMYYLSEKRIQGIIHEYESSKKRKLDGEESIRKSMKIWGERYMRDDIIIRPETPKDYKKHCFFGIAFFQGRY